ncbi:nuclear transport factor 2 family protein [Salinimicrobium flavum]|uniref:Nuclear transport factor 2 family protein n=1 Tax=Salinimicrobium flavum TaxID=1737065 RepID=A0ABW5IVX6_9FLAO
MQTLRILFIALFFGNIALAQTEQKEINSLLNDWHDAAARADYEDYFGMMAEESVFIGTDPTENWEKPAFMEWSKPYFEKGKAWSFSTLERNIFLSEDGEIGWFDELLDTQMGICRGSGVVTWENGSWKIRHYVLSIQIPNENVDEVTLLKKEFDEKFISGIRSQKE